MDDFIRSFTIDVTDNDTGKSYDYTIQVDRAIPPETLAKDFMRAMETMAWFHSQSGICPGKEATP